MSRVSIFADQDVGLEAVRFVINNKRSVLQSVVVIEENEISSLARSAGCDVIFYHDISDTNVADLFTGIELIVLAWWPKIIRKNLIDLPGVRIVNFHPSLLPYNRGKNYNFWTIVEETPFGVTIHEVNEGIDSGDILFQKTIEKNWEDTGESLYNKAKASMLELFTESFGQLVEGHYVKQSQDFSKGSIHFAKELDPVSQIFLDKTYTGKELLNLLRARTFAGKPGCFFYDQNEKFEIAITINKITK
jgi:methionyl-tRNA formyltransferase